MRYLFLLFLILNFGKVSAFEIVYPKSQNETINSDKTFFIGSESSKFLNINGNKIKLHPSGGFKYPVNLDYGINKFIIDNGTCNKVYNIKREHEKDKIYSQIINYEEPIQIITKKDNAPLRSTPVDSGLNRLQHLHSGINLKAIGEYENFYKVQLARDDYAWIMKSYVENTTVCECENKPVLGIQNHEVTNSAEIFYFNIGKKLPYILSETNNGFDLIIYGLNPDVYQFGKYEFHISNETKSMGYSSYYNEENNLIIKINKFNSNPAIVIDPGHGGSEFGAIGCLGDKEKDINLQISLKLKEKLINAGYKVFMTRETDKEIGLQERVDFTNKNGAQIFISIHNNALPDTLADREVSGTEIYYFYPQAKELARDVLYGVTQETGLQNNGVKGGSLAVVRNTNAVSILVESAYMIVPEDNEKLQNSEFQGKIAEGIFKGLEKYLNDK